MVKKTLNNTNDGHASYGKNGENGSAAIKCRSLRIEGCISLFGGNGGRGGDIEEGWDDTFGGNGGNGGSCITYTDSVKISTTVKLFAGSAGDGGNAHTSGWFRTEKLEKRGLMDLKLKK